MTGLDEADGMCPNCVTPWKCNGPAGHRVDRDHDCFLMNCKGLGLEVEQLTDILARSTSGQQAVRDFLADPATRARLSDILSDNPYLNSARSINAEPEYADEAAVEILAALAEPKP